MLAPKLIFGLLTIISSGAAVLQSEHESRPQEYYRICPLPKCTRCPSKKELRAPGIGLALETGYGAAVVRLHDGSHHQIALIEGDADYIALFSRLATGPRDRTPHHIDTNWEKWQYVRSRGQRHLNKFFGRPAAPDVAVLAAMVSKLLYATQAWLGPRQRISAAVLSSPDRIRLKGEEIDDIFDYLRIRNLMAEPDSLEELFATSAAYVGYGRGLCANYTDAYVCEREEWALPDERPLHVDFSHESLSGTIEWIRDWKSWSLEASFIDPDLGFRRVNHELPTTTEIEEENALYWKAVSKRVRELVKSFKPGISDIILTGTEATDPHLHAALRDSLADLVNKEVLVSIGNDAMGARSQDEWKAKFKFATALGAAEVAKRRQEGSVRCRQTDACRQRREHERHSVVAPKQDPTENAGL